MRTRLLLFILMGLLLPRSFIAQETEISYTETLPNGVASGDVTHDSAVLWARSTELGTLTFTISTEDNSEAQILTTEIDDATLPGKVFVEGLSPATTYIYLVEDASGATLAGRFRTPAIDEMGSVGLRFGVSGDWRGELRPYPAIANIAERDLDFFVLHGDTVYADIPSLDFPLRQARTIEEFRIKHNEVYSERFGRNDWAVARASTAVFATIDDHEITNDFAGGASPETDGRFPNDGDYINETSLYKNALQVFNEYNPLLDLTYAGTDDPRMEGRPKLYRYQTYGTDAAAITLDTRSFRDEPVDAVFNLLSGAAISRFYEESFQEGRTFLGLTQLADLQRDLLDAHERGIMWKFIMIPEPMQQFGWFSGDDRWEGYALERTAILEFIENNEIRNVVWVAADIHSTFINNVTYQTEPAGHVIDTHTFEVTTGSVAFWQPTGQVLTELAGTSGLMGAGSIEAYQVASLVEKDVILTRLFDQILLATQRLDRLGLDDSLIDAELLVGSWAAGHTYGWTEFEIEAETQILTITTYGIPAYSEADMTNDPDTYANLVPEIVNQFRVTPQS